MNEDSKLEGAPPCAPQPGPVGAEAGPPRLSVRSHPAHPPVVQKGFLSIVVYVTVCTADRQPILARPEVHAWLRQVWAKAAGWSVGRYILMPEHIHFFCAPSFADYPPLKKWVAYWKSLAAARWPTPTDGKVWQRDCWDRQLRREESYVEKWTYVRQNPVRAGLVKETEQWPYQGEMNTLMWHDK
jgi:putative transposase